MRVRPGGCWPSGATSRWCPRSRGSLSRAHDERLALQGLWSLYVVGALDTPLAEKLLASEHPYVRAWTIRLLGDEHIVSPSLLSQLVGLAYRDSSVVVRRQLACTAKRLPASETIPIIEQLLTHDEDADDIQMPLLIWWAIEDKAISDADRVLRMVQAGDLWRRPLMTRYIIERLGQRFLSERTNASAAACAKLLRHADQEKTVDLVLAGMLKMLAGQKRDDIPEPLRETVAEVIRSDIANPRAIELAMRLNVPCAADSGHSHGGPIRDRSRRSACSDQGVRRMRKHAAARQPVLALVTDKSPDPIKMAALSALGYFGDDHIADAILNRLSNRSPATAVSLDRAPVQPPGLGARNCSSRSIARAIPSSSVSRELVRRRRQYDDPRLITLIEKNWGKGRAVTPFETQGRINAVLQLLAKRPGDSTRGRPIFEKTCATCHKLNGRERRSAPTSPAPSARTGRCSCKTSSTRPRSFVRSS